MLELEGIDALLDSMGLERGHNLVGLGPVLAVKDVWGGDLLDSDAGVAVVLIKITGGWMPTVAWHINDHWVCSHSPHVESTDDFRRAVFGRVACYFAALARSWSAQFKREELDRRRGDLERHAQNPLVVGENVA